MPRVNIIVLAQPPDDPSSYTFALWADVPAARQRFYANPNAKSAWLDATSQDNLNLQGGEVVETIVTQRVPAGTSISQMQVFMQSVWSSYQAQINAANPWVRYGSTWDGTTWSIVTTA